MKLIQYILLIDLALWLLCLKLIFGSLSLFGKALVVQFFTDECYHRPAVLNRWQKRHDSRFKLSLAYWCAIAIAAISFLAYLQFVPPLA